MEDVMISKLNEPIYVMSDSLGGYHINDYMVRPNDSLGHYTISEVEAYLAEHPEALVPEPKPPEPTAEQKAARKAMDDEAKEKELDLKYIRELRKKDISFKG
jgi:hypothetical protein